jgi:hypothetical protein
MNAKSNQRLIEDRVEFRKANIENDPYPPFIRVLNNNSFALRQRYERTQAFFLSE